jgi:RNA polymerase sigma-70 factor, ECF subfamily
MDQSPARENRVEQGALSSGLLDELWSGCNASAWGLKRDDFNRILLAAGVSQNFGQAPGTTVSDEERALYFRELKLNDLVLAKACAAGKEEAWGHFLRIYSQPLTRAAIAISGSETVGRDLADAFYAELYGLQERDGERRCPLDSYRGRGSLLGWLRTTLAQRFVDHYRRTHREEPLDDLDTQAPDRGSANETPSPALATAVEDALQGIDTEERFLLAAYYIDERTLAQIAAVLRVHEATISRRLRRATEAVRKEIVRNLLKAGMSRRAADEALGADPRDVELRMDLKKLLQPPETRAFSEKAPVADSESERALSEESISGEAKAAG